MYSLHRLYFLSLTMALCAWVLPVHAQTNVTLTRVKVCFVFFANVDDLGWTYSQNVGRLRAKAILESMYPGVTVDTLAIPNGFFTAVTPEEKAALFQQLKNERCEVTINMLEYSFEAVPTVAAWDARARANTNMTFIVLWDNPEAVRYRGSPNLVFFQTRFLPGYFLAGVAAATQARGCIGFDMPFVGTRNGHDAASGFLQGVKYVNASKPVHVTVMNSYYDPPNEILVTKIYHEQYGCDVTARYSDPRDADVYVLSQAARGFMSIGSHVDLQQYVGDSVLISVYNNWENIFVPLLSDIIRFGSVQASRPPLLFGVNDGVVQVSTVSPRARAGVQAAVDAAKASTFAVNDVVLCGSGYVTTDGTPLTLDPATGCRNVTQMLPGLIATPALIFHGDFHRPTECANGSAATYDVSGPTMRLVCSVCAPNTFAVSGDRICQPCPDGLVAAANASRCEPPKPPASDSSSMSSVIVLCCVAAALVLMIIGIATRVRYAGWKKNKVAPKSVPLCLLFTDVESSTDLWNQYPEAMSVAMATHHATIRRVIEEYGAYEVKTIGDAFMIAVPAPLDGILLACDIQMALYEAEWPADFTYRSSTNPVPWNGLKVRIGVHSCHEVEVKYEALRNYYDYYGNDVNIAARVEAFAQGGQICATQSTWREATDDPRFDTELSKTVEGRPWANNVQLKGIDGGFTIFSILPAELGQRFFAPVEGHENDFAEVGIEEFDDSKSTSSVTSEGDAGAIIRQFFNLMSPGARRILAAGVAKDWNLPIRTNTRRAVTSLVSAFLERAKVSRMLTGGLSPPAKTLNSSPTAAKAAQYMSMKLGDPFPLPGSREDFE